MLSEIKCAYFSESPVKFTSGLNIILGDDKSTNSIGKSTLLMIIDFGFGGKSYIEKNSGSIKVFGNHELYFTFLFNNQPHFFIRSTDESDIIWRCNEFFVKIEPITVNEYSKFLQEAYLLENIGLSFRSICSLYSRIWGKQNSNVDKPLQSFNKEPDRTQIQNIIKLFERFEDISNALSDVKVTEDSKKVVGGIFRQNYVRKITKTEYKTNLKRIEDIESSINDIQNNLLEYTLNIEELSSKEVIKLKTEKHHILDNKSLILNKITRIELNLSEKSRIKSKQLERLADFFENPNTDKINQIESFHNKISKILRKQLLASKKTLEEEIKIINDQIAHIDDSINKLLEGVESPKFIIDKVLDLTIDKNKLKDVNKYYDEKQKITSDLKQFNTSLDETIETVLKEISLKINNSLHENNSEVYRENKKAPSIILNRKSHQYNHSDNTGTGKSYIDLVIFDLSILELTKLPFLIHDSFLFKNIEDDSVDKILNKYTGFKKQIFISIDGTNKFSNQEIIKNSTRIKLSNDKLLFKKDWR